MSKKLEGKVAVVTGASRGIGRAIALKLAQDGASVVIHYGASKKAAEEAAEEIKKAGGQAFLAAADLNDSTGPAKLEAAVEKAVGGKIDILVNNAGVAEFVSLTDTTEAQFDKHFNVNVKSLFFITQKFVPKLNDGGRIINISSVVARAYFPGIPAYSATKGAVDTLTKHFAAELGQRNITVNSISPGGIDTDMSAWIRSDEGATAAKQMQAIPRVGKAEDIADAVAALAGPEGRWITGQIIEVSGGAKL